MTMVGDGSLREAKNASFTMAMLEYWSKIRYVYREININEMKINIALTGYANVGKSVIFNYLTGLHQHIGNWPGKTIARAEGTLYYKGYTIDILDLPGVYSLSHYSTEEHITRNYILHEKPDVIINVLDATNLETNLILALQILELEKNTVIAMNMMDRAKKKGIVIDWLKLTTILGAPVVPVTATTGKGIAEMLDHSIAVLHRQYESNPVLEHGLKYGKEVEERILALSQLLAAKELAYPARFTAIKLLEKDEEICNYVAKQASDAANHAKILAAELENIHGHDASILIADERSVLASRIVKEICCFDSPDSPSIADHLENLTAHIVFGYPIMLLTLGLVFAIVFGGGSFLADIISQLAMMCKELYQENIAATWLANLAWGGIESFLALIEIALPTILPFYVLMFILEDCGYLARVAYLMDHFMHSMGIHGKACMPLILGFGCNVPACLGCRIMETERERFITGLLAVFIPCGATTIVVAGLVGKFLGTGVAMALYLGLFVIMFVIGKIAAMVVPGEPTELIMKMPNYKLPNMKTIALQTWIRLREFIYIASPMVILSGILINSIVAGNFFAPINAALAPITVTWLKLPAITGVLLLFGIIRKELILVMLATLLGTTNFAVMLSPRQILTLAIISMLYIPCVATIAALYKEFGLKKAAAITILKILLALVIAGIVARGFDVLHFTN